MDIKINGFTIIKYINEVKEIELNGFKKMISNLFGIPRKLIYYCDYKAILYINDSNCFNMNDIVKTMDGSEWIVIGVTSDDVNNRIVVENINKERANTIVGFDKITYIDL